MGGVSGMLRIACVGVAIPESTANELPSGARGRAG